MISYHSGNILDDEADILVNAVNCVGVMGKGLALQVKQRHPQVFAAYRQACRRGEVAPGRLHVAPFTGTHDQMRTRFIVNFPTKRDWREPSRVEDIRLGLQALPGAIESVGSWSIAIPPLGCGLGGLDWHRDVEPLVLEALEPVADVDVRLYAPRRDKAEGS